MRCEFCGEPAENDAYWVMFEGDRDETPTCELCYERLVSHLEAETSRCEHNWEKTDSYVDSFWDGYADDAVMVEELVIEYTCTKCGAEKEESFDGSEYDAETSSDLDCSYCGISGEEREGEPLCSRCLGCFECCETLHDEGQHDAEMVSELNWANYDSKPEVVDVVTDPTQNRVYVTVRYYTNRGRDYHDVIYSGDSKKVGLAAEGETPIMPPMGFGESVNWRPHDGTPSLRRDRRRSEGDEDYGEPACHICQEHTDEPAAADEYCEVCEMSLCVGCFNHESHTCGDQKSAETFSAPKTAYSMIEYQDDWCLGKIAEKVKKEKHGLEWNEGYTSWDSDSDGNVILGIWGKDDNRLDKIIYDRKALAEALKSVGYKNPESWGSEGDEDYGEPACHICREHTDEPDAVDKYCGNCNMGLCEGCYNDESHTCLTGEVTNITNVGKEVYVTIRLSDGREQILLGSMEDVMLNAETVRFNAVTDAYAMAYSQGHAHGRQQKTYDPKLSKEERNVFTEAWKAR